MGGSRGFQRLGGDFTHSFLITPVLPPFLRVCIKNGIFIVFNKILPCFLSFFLLTFFENASRKFYVSVFKNLKHRRLFYG
jgi:hypothetical protein